jgi:hypothetical protein
MITRDLDVFLIYDKYIKKLLFSQLGHLSLSKTKRDKRASALRYELCS